MHAPTLSSELGVSMPVFRLMFYNACTWMHLHQNHMLRTSSEIQHIEYSPDSITYKKFDARSVERLKLAAGTPKSVRGGTMQWDASQRLLTVQATAREVSISLSK